MEQRIFESGNVKIVLVREGGHISARVVLSEPAGEQEWTLPANLDLNDLLLVLHAAKKNLSAWEREMVSKAIDSSVVR